MSDESPLKTVREGAGALAEIIKLAGDDPSVKAAASNIGQAAATITKTINNALLPLAAINFAFERARHYFSGRFQADLLTKTAAIPLGNLIEPKASIAGPAMQGLAFAHDETDLREMYLHLLKTSMDSEHAEEAHPAFVEIIRQLEPEDAEFVRDLMAHRHPIRVAQVHITRGASGSNYEGRPNLYEFSARFVVEPSFLRSLRMSRSPKLSAIVDNLLRLGLVQVNYDELITNLLSYEWLFDLAEVARLAKAADSEGRLTRKKGVLLPTSLGTRFAAAVGLSISRPHRGREA